MGPACQGKGKGGCSVRQVQVGEVQQLTKLFYHWRLSIVSQLLRGLSRLGVAFLCLLLKLKKKQKKENINIAANNMCSCCKS